MGKIKELSRIYTPASFQDMKARKYSFILEDMGPISPKFNHVNNNIYQIYYIYVVIGHQIDLLSTLLHVVKYKQHIASSS